MFILYIILAIVILLFMVLVHEFGHYCVGRMLNFKITEFSVGFGKALFSRKNKRGELISLRIFPLGGYCAFEGEDDNADGKDSFNAQAPWKRILVFFAGVIFNFATAVVFSLILLCTLGYDIPQVVSFSIPTSSTSPQNGYIINNVETNSNIVNLNDEQLLQEGDVIISINGEKIDFAYGANYNDIITSQLNNAIAWAEENNTTVANYPALELVVRRDGQYTTAYTGFSVITRQKVLSSNQEGEYELSEEETVYSTGITAKAYVHSFTEALQRCVPFAIGLAWIVLKSLWLLITFQLPISSIGGPITTITTIASFTQANFANILVLIPLISANLAIFNILPIPALDGSHVLFTTIEWIRKKPIKREVENLIHTIGLIVLFGAVILIDILHFLL